MSDERDDEGRDSGKGGDATEESASSIDDLRDKMTRAANEFLKSRLGLEEGIDGSLQLPDQGTFADIGQRADQFVRGFFRGFVDKTPEEREVASGLRDPKDVPSPTEVAARLLGRVSDTMSGAFHEYLKDKVVDPDQPDEQVVVDGRFIMRHGGPLLASMVRALGTRFSGGYDGGIDAAREPVDAGAPEGAETETKQTTVTPYVDYKVDLPSVFMSMFVRPPPSDEEEKS